MINITFDNTPKTKEVVIEGHAGYAVTGKDIVCAGVSAIASALMGYAENYADRYDCDIAEDGGYLRLVVESSADAQFEAVFQMALIGFLQIEMSYSEYVTVNIKK